MRKLYGRDLPFYDSSQSYVEYELNRSDVRFVVWYALCMYSADRRVCNPFDSEILKAADAFFERFDALYEDAPTPEDHNIARHLELTNEEDKEESGISQIGCSCIPSCSLRLLRLPFPKFSVSRGSMIRMTSVPSGRELKRRCMKIRQDHWHYISENG